VIPHVIETDGAGPIRHEAWICHGILGSAANWRSFARRLVADLPGWRVVLIDLRAHGDSPRGEPPHTVSACADDLVELATARGHGPEVLVGHSFGGKVALLAAERLPDVRQLWVIDAVPGPGTTTDAGGDEDVVGVIRTLTAIPQPLARREDVRAPLAAAGFSDGLAGWMTTNLARTDAGFVWRFDLRVVELLLRDYARLDLWDRVRGGARTVHVVRAGRSARWTPEALAALDRAAAAGAVVHVLPDAGHWVHVDAPEALADLLRSGFEDVVQGS
jgi:pimeloyl-ACP methyl ester carboxylesterase